MGYILIKGGETTAARKHVEFHLVDATDGITPEAGEAAGQPQISVNGGAWTDTGIGTLTAIAGAANGRYVATLTDALVAVGQIGDIIRTRYKSAETAETPGPTFQVVTDDPALSVSVPVQTGLTAQGYTAARAGKLDNLDAAITTRCAALTGSQTITIAIKDQFGVVFPGAVVDVYDASNTTFIGRATDDDSDGIVAILRNPGTYSIRVLADGFQADTIPETLVVTVDAAVTYTGVRFVTPASSDPTKVTISGYLRDATGATHDDVEIRISGSRDNLTDNNTLTNRVVTVTSGPNGNPAWAAGYVEFELLRESVVRLESASIGVGLNKTVTAPDAASASLDALLATAP